MNADAFEQWFHDQFSKEKTTFRDKQFARYGFVSSATNFNSIMGKLGAVSKQYQIAKTRLASLETEVLRLKAERDAVIEAMDA